MASLLYMDAEIRPNRSLSERGFIILQDHGDPVWYRNVRIRGL